VPVDSQGICRSGCTNCWLWPLIALCNWNCQNHSVDSACTLFINENSAFYFTINRVDARRRVHCSIVHVISVAAAGDRKKSLQVVEQRQFQVLKAPADCTQRDARRSNAKHSFNNHPCGCLYDFVRASCHARVTPGKQTQQRAWPLGIRGRSVACCCDRDDMDDWTVNTSTCINTIYIKIKSAIFVNKKCACWVHAVVLTVSVAKSYQRPASTVCAVWPTNTLLCIDRHSWYYIAPQYRSCVVTRLDVKSINIVNSTTKHCSIQY